MVNVILAISVLVMRVTALIQSQEEPETVYGRGLAVMLGITQQDLNVPELCGEF